MYKRGACPRGPVFCFNRGEGRCKKAFSLPPRRDSPVLPPLKTPRRVSGVPAVPPARAKKRRGGLSP